MDVAFAERLDALQGCVLGEIRRLREQVAQMAEDLARLAHKAVPRERVSTAKMVEILAAEGLTKEAFKMLVKRNADLRALAEKKGQQLRWYVPGVLAWFDSR